MTTTSDAPPMEVNDAQQRRRQFAQAQEAKFDQIRKEFRPVEGNPLITPLTRFMDVPDADLDVLYRIRKDGDFEMPPMPLLKTHIDEDNKPLNIRRYQKQMICHLAAMPRFIDGDAVGLGKAQPLNAEVLTPTGWCLMGDLRVGDAVVDPDGGIGQVEGIFPQGRRQVFTLTTSDGGSTEACGEHLWTVQTVEDRRRGGSRTLTTQQLLAQGLTGSPTGARKQWRRNRFFLPLPEPIEFADGEHLPLHPYLLGALLGDGSTRTWSPTLTTTDAEILQQVERSLPPNTQLVPSTHDPITHYLTRKTKVGRNPVRIALEDLGAWGHAAWEKHIPTCYLHASIPERKDLLAALLDTDGECSKAGLVYFHTTSPTLANDVATLIRSLGGIARVSSPRKKTYKHQGETRVGRPAYCVTIKTTFNPFMLRRKAARWKPQLLARAIVSITPTRVTETQCIRVSTQRHLYLTNDYIVTHNTLCSIAALCAYHEQLRREGKAMKVIVFTTTSTAHQWATEIERFSGLRPWVLKDAYKFKGDSKMTYGHKARLAQLQKFLDHPKLDVLICRYSQWIGRRKKLTTALDADQRPVDSEGRERLSQEIRDLRDALKPIRGRGAMILDETHKIKNPESQIRAMVVSIHRRFHRVWGLTATAIKNHLEEFYSIAAALGVTPLGSLNYFREHHCDWSLQNAGGRVVPKIVGYRGLDKFKVGMRPWYWGRSQAQVKEPLPKLTTIYHPVELSDEESKLLLVDIPSGNFALPPVLKKVAGEVELVERDTSNMMTMLSVYQLVSNSMALLDTSDLKAFHSPKLSSKEEILLDLLDGDLAGEKVICYAQPLDARVLTPTGWVAMGDLRVGDPVCDPDGGVGYVEGVYPQGDQPIYRMTTKSGASTRSTLDHLWLIQTYTDIRRKTGKWRIFDTAKLLRRGGPVRVNKNGSRHFKYFIPLPVPPATQVADLPIPPYTLGVLLGDGDITRGVTFASMDPEVVERVRGELRFPNLKVVRHGSGISWGISQEGGKGYASGQARSSQGRAMPGSNPYAQALRDLDLLGTNCFSKHIPAIYLHATVPERLALLQGLMDTDGTYNTATQRPHFTTTSESLALGVVELVRSLGGVAYLRGPYTQTYSHRGHSKTGAPSWQVGVNLALCPFSLPRKAQQWRAPRLSNPIATIEAEGRATCQCIRVSTQRHLYITDDYVVTHNTKYRSWIDRLQHLTQNNKFTARQFLRITGAESGKARERNRLLFQGNPEYDFIAINSAAIEGVNLQQAAHLICLDLPWSWGDLIQLVGRMVRMASPHAACTLHILFARGTVDEYVIEIQKSKKGVFERILGSAGTVGLLEEGKDLGDELDQIAVGLEDESKDDFRDMLRAHAQKVGLGAYVNGTILAKESAGMRRDVVIGKSGVRAVTEEELEDRW